MYLWYMLRASEFLKTNYNASFVHYINSSIAKYMKCSYDENLLQRFQSFEEWEKYKKIMRPWEKLVGIGENVFDFIFGDIQELPFVQDSYKLDSANERFFKVTGIAGLLENGLERRSIVEFLRKLDLPYTVREINKGLYTYCSETERYNYGFCRSKNKCQECKVFSICHKNLD